MTKTTITHCYRRTSHNWRADRKIFIAPKILNEYFFKGERFYKCEGGRKFIADTYDALLRAIPGKLKPRNYKGELIGGFYE